MPDLLISCLDSIPKYVSTTSLSDYGTELLKAAPGFNTLDNPYNDVGKLVRLDELFDDKSGIASSEVVRSKEQLSPNWIPFIWPSYRQETCIDAYVNKELVPKEKVFDAGTLYVSTDGQGSHTFSYVSTFEFVPNSNVTVLIPKHHMSLQEKLYYAQCITQNRYNFSYGRKPKGERLKEILLPEYPSKYAVEYNMECVLNSFSRVLTEV